MSWHLSCCLTSKPLAPIRLTAVHKAVSIGLLYSMSAAVLSPMAQAATMSETVVASAQHQPLVAVISVSDVSAADFSASLANPKVYKQLGLSATDSMSVHFVPTSATTGTLVISTTQPVSMPFADVVLAINDNGQRNVIPKTLLMPLANSVPVEPPPQIIAATQKSNISVVNDSATQILTVKRGMPPPLFTTLSPQSPSLQASSLQIPTNKMANIQAQVAMPVASASTKVSTTNIRPIDSLTPNLTAENPTIQTDTVKDDTTNSLAASSVTNKITSTTNLDVSQLSNTSTKIDNKNKHFDTLNIQVSRQIKLSSPTDVANQPLIMAKNTLEISTEPDPLPAQITTQSQSSNRNDKVGTAPTEKSSNKVDNARAITAKPSANESTVAKSVAPKTPNKPVAPAALPPAQASMLAPTLNESMLNNVMDTDIVSLLQKSRQRTTAQAKQALATNSSLSIYRKRLQLQNQKRVELEARFKKLRHQ